MIIEFSRWPDWAWRIRYYRNHKHVKLAIDLGPFNMLFINP